ncbi:hypothetical protein ACOSQ4_012461 [Xanthoceras sorbifolium]
MEMPGMETRRRSGSPSSKMETWLSISDDGDLVVASPSSALETQCSESPFLPMENQRWVSLLGTGDPAVIGLHHRHGDPSFWASIAMETLRWSAGYPSMTMIHFHGSLSMSYGDPNGFHFYFSSSV